MRSHPEQPGIFGLKTLRPLVPGPVLLPAAHYNGTMRITRHPLRPPRRHDARQAGVNFSAANQSNQVDRRLNANISSESPMAKHAVIPIKVNRYVSGGHEGLSVTVTPDALDE